MVHSNKEYCPTCKHIIAKDSINLSSIKYRSIIHAITDMESLYSSKDYFIRFIRSTYRVREFAEQFASDLEDKINGVGLFEIKLWLLDFINNPRDLETLQERFSEIKLYRFLFLVYSEINEPFSQFYNKYVNYIRVKYPEIKPMNKNIVSRALFALGLKTTMKRTIVGTKSKCTIMLVASENELSSIYEKNGFTSLPQTTGLH